MQRGCVSLPADGWRACFAPTRRAQAPSPCRHARYFTLTVSVTPLLSGRSSLTVTDLLILSQVPKSLRAKAGDATVCPKAIGRLGST